MSEKSASLKNFDLIVIGGGPGGYVAAIRAAQLGMNVACVEKGSTLGGTCLNIGCVPSKALLDASEQYVHAQKSLKDMGVEVGEVKLNLEKMMGRKDSIVKSLTQGIDGLFKKNKITRLTGVGRLGGRDGEQHIVEVLTNSKVSDALSSPRVILATGSVPVELPNLKFDEKNILSSTGALALNAVPKRFAVVGGGYIGLEMASVWSRLGSDVTVIEFMDKVLALSDQGFAVDLRRQLEKQGLKFRLSTKVLGAELSKSGVDLKIQDTLTGKDESLQFDKVLVCPGRRPYVEQLGLESVGLATNAKGMIEVDQNYQTSVAGVYAIGDLIHGPMLAHKAEEEGVVAVERMQGQASHVNYNLIPSVIYTHPELASVGKTEEQLVEAGIPYKSGSFPFMANARAKALGDVDGKVKILAHADSDEILGAHILHARASEMIAEIVLAMEFKASSEDIARTSHAHPSLPESVKEAAMAVSKRAIHI